MPTSEYEAQKARAAANPLHPSDHRHGTPSGYSNWHCHCAACRAAHAAQTARMREERKAIGLAPDDPRHGKDSTYSNYRCKCAACRHAHAEATRERNARRRARLAGSAA